VFSKVFLTPELAQARVADRRHAINAQHQGPEHSRLRKPVTKSFAPRMIDKLKPIIDLD
jgi:cytochrome P450